jgi:hypothetical protein
MTDPFLDRRVLALRAGGKEGGRREKREEGRGRGREGGRGHVQGTKEERHQLQVD